MTIQMPDYNRIRTKVLNLMTVEQPGKIFSIGQVAGSINEEYRLTGRVMAKLLILGQIKKNNQGWYCGQAEIPQAAKVKGDAEDTLGQEIKELIKDQRRKPWERDQQR